MKKLVVLSDGTGNEIGENISNVLKLYWVLRKTSRTSTVGACLSITSIKPCLELKTEFSVDAAEVAPVDEKIGFTIGYQYPNDPTR